MSTDGGSRQGPPEHSGWCVFSVFSKTHWLLCACAPRVFSRTGRMLCVFCVLQEPGCCVPVTSRVFSRMRRLVCACDPCVLQDTPAGMCL